MDMVVGWSVMDGPGMGDLVVEVSGLGPVGRRVKPHVAGRQDYDCYYVKRWQANDL